MVFFKGAGATIAIGYTKIDWSVYGEAILALISIIEGILLYIAGNATQLWVAYVTYMSFCILYSLLITIARYLLNFFPNYWEF